MNTGSRARTALAVYGLLVLAFLYLPLIAVFLASISESRYLSFPIRSYAFDWYGEALESDTIAGLLATSLRVAGLVTLISVILGFFGALAFARYHWRFRGLFQKLILLPIFFPQTVLGLALLMWINALGIIPDWRTAVVAHVVWVAPIATLIIAIRAYSFDPALEEAARDLGASTWTVLREVTVPLLMPGVVTAGLFAFLLSWGNFPLSLFTTGADSTLPEWLYARMVSGYSPLVPTVGILSVGASVLLILGAGLATVIVRRLRTRPERRRRAAARAGPPSWSRAPGAEAAPGQ